ncbi:hypothetical protein E2C01_059750 [Portunus trituberculatus]|uniref:Uncharacterized protein n=1 Tax=Portunus trituberculatus TaxID=210409 RepID=A0A5B7H3G0_PORTR|nr:hypothetical protein [Portunus trituberculatus]
MLAHSCSHVLIVGDFNHYLERDAYEKLLEVQSTTLKCHQLGLVGSSEHHAVLIQLDVGVAQDKATTRTIWLWNKADSAQQGSAQGGMQEDGADQQMGHKKVGGKPFSKTAWLLRKEQNLVVPC